MNKLALLVAASMATTASAAPWRVTSESAFGSRDAAVAERIARAHLPPGEWQLLANQLDGELRTVTFQQTHGGAIVVGAHMGFVFGRDRLIAVHDHSQHVTATARPGQVIVKNIAVDVVETPTETLYKRGPDIIERKPKVMFGSATLKYNASVRYPLATRADMIAPNATITVNGSMLTTTPTGTFSWSGTSPATVTTSVSGSYVNIINQAGAPASAVLTAPNNGIAVWDASADEFTDAQVSAFVYVNKAKARARLINPAITAWLDTPLNVYVNEASTCNASSDGTELHFYRASAMCENTARIADVVFHEFGHSVHAHSVIPGMGNFDSHLSEGLADFFEANITEDPAFARGFYLDDAPLRTIDPVGRERVYPLDYDFDPHVSGLIIGGALWDLRKALVASLGYNAGVARTEQIFTGIMQRADDISTTFTPALLADDDDADLTNGTPNFCAIQNAFGRHGLVPDYQATTVTAPIVTERHIALQVSTPTGTLCPPASITRMSVTWKTGDGVASSFELTPSNDEWGGDFPDQPNGTLVYYSVDVQFNDGSELVFPNNPADPLYELMIGHGTPIWCESMDADPAWDQTSSFGFDWEWAMLPAGPVSGDPRAAHTGTGALGTDLKSDGLYRSNATTTISTPVIDVSQFARVHLQYWRWLDVEDAQYDRASILANGAEVWSNVSSVNGTLDHVDREWRYHDLDVTEQVTREGTMQIAWFLKSDGSKELGGWTLDDVCLVGFDSIGRCGDGILEEGEQCDDGNNVRSDGCSERCYYEPVSGGGGCSTSGSPGLIVALGYLWSKRSRRAPSRSVSARMP
jgi:cysteine-rich repeat protein